MNLKINVWCFVNIIWILVVFNNEKYIIVIMVILNVGVELFSYLVYMFILIIWI